jgi:VWFA-related protein
MTQLQGRKSVVVASHGFILDSDLAGFRDVVTASLRASAPVHLIDMRRHQPLRARQQLEQQTAKDLGDAGSWQLSPLAFAEPAAGEGTNMLAVETGGLRIPAAHGSTRELRLIGEMARTYYLLGYESTELRRDGKFRRVAVEMTRRLTGTRVLSRRGYFAPVN